MHSFKKVIGNDHIVGALQSALRRGCIGHALCVAGKLGSGRKLITYAFAKALQCESLRDADSCGVCASCVSFEAGTHPDIFHIRPEKTSIGVEVVRERIVAEIAHRPHRYPYKIFIIEDAAALTPQAQNALLKTLEEPCGYGVFVLVAEKHESLLPTVRSRCITYSTRPVGVAEITEYLAQHTGLSGDECVRLAQLSQGSIGRALRLATDEEFTELRAYAAELAEGRRTRSLVESFAQAKELERYKHRISDVFDIMSMRYRDELIVGETGESCRAMDPGTGLQSIYSKDSILRKLAAVDKARERLRFNGNFQMVMDSLLLIIREA